jgi:hypothetical protein
MKSTEEEQQESFRKMAALIQDMNEVEQEAVYRFMESLQDSELTEQDWINLYGHRAPRIYRPRFTRK